MSIIANGITLPTNGDNLQVNGILVDRVIANGVTVWEKQKTYYAYQNGIANTSVGITNPTIYLSNEIDGEIHSIAIATYENTIGVMALVRGSAGGRGPIFGAQTPNIPTNGLAHVLININYFFIYDHGGVGTAHSEIYGINASGISTLLSHKIAGTNEGEVFNVSNYKNIKVVMRWECGGGSSGLDKQLFIGIKEIKFY